MFMVLEGAMMISAVSALTLGHPGPALGTAMWQAGGFSLRRGEKGGVGIVGPGEHLMGAEGEVGEEEEDKLELRSTPYDGGRVV